jgi:hypothetical protein
MVEFSRNGGLRILLVIVALAFLLGHSNPTAVVDAAAVADAGKPTFVVTGLPMARPMRIVAYGDMRFTDPHNQTDSNPRIRQWLVKRVLEEKPDLLLLSGDLPFRGSTAEDWKIFRQETADWRTAELRIYTTLGNHEIYTDHAAGLRNYFENFPELQGHRWYSVQAGSIYVISLDSMSPVVDGSPQREWVRAQLAALPPEINFVFVLSHLPMMADLQSEVVAHLPTPEQAALRDFLEARTRSLRAKVIVVNGHIHNYERFEHNGITYLISGGGGAKPYPILVRGEQDLYQASGFTNFHYVVITIDGKHASATMYRVADPDAKDLRVEPKDFFMLDAK